MAYVSSQERGIVDGWWMMKIVSMEEVRVLAPCSNTTEPLLSTLYCCYPFFSCESLKLCFILVLSRGKDWREEGEGERRRSMEERKREKKGQKSNLFTAIGFPEHSLSQSMMCVVMICFFFLFPVPQILEM